MLGHPTRINKYYLALVLGLFFCVAAFGHKGSRISAPSSIPPLAESKETDQEVLKVNEECNTAELHGDVSAMEKCETDDFTHTHANGSVEHKAEYLKGVGSGAHKFLSLDLSDLHVRSYGDSSAIVEGNIHLRADNSGKIADVNNRLMTVWVKLQGKWREAAWIAVRVPANAASEPLNFRRLASRLPMGKASVWTAAAIGIGAAGLVKKGGQDATNTDTEFACGTRSWSGVCSTSDGSNRGRLQECRDATRKG